MTDVDLTVGEGESHGLRVQVRGKDDVGRPARMGSFYLNLRGGGLH